MELAGWGRDCAAFRIINGDANHLYGVDNCPRSLVKYLDRRRRFVLRDFLDDLLERIDTTVEKLFGERMNPPQLERVTPNRVLRNGTPPCAKCSANLAESNRLFKQCSKCAYTVSQTKVGICLQFQWRSDCNRVVYCSIDIVPTYSIREFGALSLAKLVNTGMLASPSRPQGWLKYLQNYVTSDMVLTDILDTRRQVESVFLKLLQNSHSDVYYIRPGQLLGQEKFCTQRHHLVYQQIKFLKKCLQLADVDMYMVKKLLWKPEVNMLHYETVTKREFVIRVLSLPELKHHFQTVIDFRKWDRMNAIEKFFHPQFP